MFQIKYFFFFFFEIVSCRPGWPGIHYVAENDLKVLIFLLLSLTTKKKKACGGEKRKEEKGWRDLKKLFE